MNDELAIEILLHEATYKKSYVNSNFFLSFVLLKILLKF
jgi:hypothetical protein